MGILGNFARANAGALRYQGGAQALTRGNLSTNRPAHWRNTIARDGATSVLALMAMPHAYYPPAAWRMPVRVGEAAGYSDVAFGASATGLMGLPASGSAALSLSATATAQLIASGQGSASMALSVSGAMTGTVQGGGSAALSISTNAPTLGALAGGAGTAALSFGASGALTGIGNMTGTTDVVTELTAAAIAAEVLSAAAAAPISANVEKVRGQALEGTGTELDPWGPA